MNLAGPGDRPLILAYDGSEDAANAIACAGRLLAPRPSLVVHSFAGLSHLLLRSNLKEVSGSLAEAAREIDAADAAEAERLAAEGARLARAAGFEAQAVVVEQDGRPWQSLIACAEKHQAAAIVAGTRGRSAVARALMGSTSTGLVEHSEVPVLVVPAEATPDAAEGPALLCFDRSPHSRRAIESAGAMLARKDAVLLHAWESWVAHAPTYVPAVGASVGGVARELDEEAASLSDEIAGEGVEAAEAAGFDARPLSIRSDAVLWRRLLDAADDSDAGVIVLGSRGLSGVSAVLGSVSYGVVHHARRPVLVALASTG